MKRLKEYDIPEAEQLETNAGREERQRPMHKWFVEKISVL